MKRVAMTCLVALGLSLGGAMSAQAGETTGNDAPIPNGGAHNASSLCAFSGQDLPDALENQPNIPDDFVTDGHVQSYGMYVRADLKDAVPSPGFLCRGNLVFEE